MADLTNLSQRAELERKKTKTKTKKQNNRSGKLAILLLLRSCYYFGERAIFVSVVCSIVPSKGIKHFM